MRATVLMGSWPESAAEAHNAFDASVAVSRTRTQIARRPQWVAAISVFVAYYLGSKIGFLLTFQPHPVSVLWPPNSILLAALLLTPARTWWLALLAAFPAHLAAQLQSNVPPAMLLCWFISNSCEALIGAGCVRYLIRGPVRFDRLRDVGIFCGFAAVAGPFLSSFVDAGFVALNHWGQDGYWQVWRIRFTSNVLATLTLVPLIVSWSRGGIDWLGRIRRAQFFEGAVLVVALVWVNAVVFYGLGPAPDSALLYLPLPFLIWAAVRFGARGVSAAICAVTFFAIWSAGHGYGPFSTRSPEENALSIQMFLIVTSIPLLLLPGFIEERARGAMALREREDRITLAAESANLAFWTINFDSDESWMNDQGRAMFDFGRDEPLTRALFLSRVHPEDREGIVEAIEVARATSPVFELEHRVVRLNGETRSIISRGRYLRNERGVIRELIGVAIDVTAQVKANHELRMQREEMAHMSRVSSMGELTASLAHELNQPLTAIASNAAAGKRLLEQGAPDPQMFKELLADVLADARRAGDIIHGIHHFVRKSEGTRLAVNLNDIVREVLRFLHTDSIGRMTVVQTELLPDLPTVEADPRQLQQVLLNLLMNSLDAMEHTPPERRRVVVCTAREDSFVVVTVRDYGHGLPKDDLEKVFSHFYSTKVQYRSASALVQSARARGGARAFYPMNTKQIVETARKLSKPYRVTKGKKFRLKDVDPGDTGKHKEKDKARAKEALHDGVEVLTELQDMLYGQDRWSLLLIFQAMDAAGKDGTIKHVMSGINPQGCQVSSFKAPTSTDLDHDFLWRCVKELPERGRIGIFNRSYYEETLVVRVHPEFLAGQKLPERCVTKHIWDDRFQDIRAFERYLTRNGTIVRKFFLHVSKEEQQKRFLERLDQPDKNWKFSANDAKERGFWDDYMKAYEETIRETATEDSPWYVVPADNKWFTRVVVASAVIDTLASLKMSYPKLSPEQAEELAAARKALLASK